MFIIFVLNIWDMFHFWVRCEIWPPGTECTLAAGSMCMKHHGEITICDCSKYVELAKVIKGIAEIPSVVQNVFLKAPHLWHFASPH